MTGFGAFRGRKGGAFDGTLNLMRVLVADPFPDEALTRLKHLSLDVDYRPGIGRDRLGAELAGMGILVVRSTEVTREAIDRATHLDLIVRAGAGVNNIDVAAASARGIYVACCPGKNAIAVAELAMGLILALDRRIPEAVSAIRSGIWDKKEFGRAAGLFGKSIGIAGLGSIGRHVVARARSFGLIPHAWSRTLTPQRAQESDVVFASSLEQLASRSEILSLHLPLTERTRGIVGREVLEHLRSGAILINTARAEIIDEAALLELVPKKNLRVGLDVWSGEPAASHAEVRSPLFELPGVYVTPHVGASTEQAQAAIADETVRIVRSFLGEGEVPNVVNVSSVSPARFQLVVRHLDRVGVLANVLAVIKRHGINVEELSNTVFDGALAACAKIRLGSRPSEACLSEIAAFSDEVLHVDLVPLPARA